MTFDKSIRISSAGTRKAIRWPTVEMLWSEFADKLRIPVRSAESYAAYLRMTKAQQDALKDVGGFVGGELLGGCRKNTAVVGRDLVTLDLDAIPAGGTNAIRQAVALLGCASVVYSTRKHEPGRPRLRVVVPLDRTATPEEYEPIARRLGERLGITCCDPTTFQPVRMMYWPSCCADGEYIYDCTDAPFASADALLATYSDWHDMTRWPQAPGQTALQKSAADKQEDPTEKSGIIGAWCRKYDVYRAMSELLPGVYVPTAEDGRYTYALGSTTGGAIVYGDGKFLYSHHGTDPAGGRLVNSWDLVRLHKFADRDDNTEAGTPTNRLPSYTAMTELARMDTEVMQDLMLTRLHQTTTAFDAAPVEGEISAPIEDDWRARLRADSNGGIQKTIDNLIIILRGDPRLSGRIAFNAFAQQMVARGALPWDACADIRPWTDVDDAGLTWYVEARYGITGKDRIASALAMIAQENFYDEVVTYLRGLAWDGVPRVEGLLVKYLLADDTPYVRAVTRKTLTAAVARAFEPGIKYDTVLTLLGGQGIGKSMFADILGGAWYSDSIQTFEGKDAAEQLRNTWIMEISEIDRFSGREEAACKRFITSRNDIYREAYGRRTAPHPRRCIFIGTANPDAILTDDSGGRRWWIVYCRATADRRGADMAQLRAERDQVWAEAVALWSIGEPLTLDGREAQEARKQQEAARISDPWEGEILDFVSRRVPEDWGDRTLQQRRAWWADDFGQRSETVTLVERRQICALEVWCEALAGDKKAFGQREARRINRVLSHMQGWEADRLLRTIYGRQRGFVLVTK